MIHVRSFYKFCLCFVSYLAISALPAVATPPTAPAPSYDVGSQNLQGSEQSTSGQQSDALKVDLFDGRATAASNSAFRFPRDFVGSPLIRKVVIVTNDGSRTVELQPSIMGDNSFSIVAGGCGVAIPPGKHCPVVVQFSPSKADPTMHSAVLTLRFKTDSSDAAQSVELIGEGVTFDPGQVGPTANPQVAQYTLNLPRQATWSIDFGPTVAYGRSTSTQTLEEGGAGSMFVAGMLPNTTYHMRASITLNGGAQTFDVDHTFTTGALPPGTPATLQTMTTPGLTPQPGIELVNPLIGVLAIPVLATDLQGNVIWTYTVANSGGSGLYPVHPLPNGHFLRLIAPLGVPTGNALNVIREFDLAGNTVQELSMTQLNSELAAKGFPLTLNVFSHDVLLLPNGHYLVIANLFKDFTSVAGYSGPVSVLGDAVIDLDSKLRPQWVWNSFDHLDVNRHPMAFPDWTHANSLAYSTDDGNFLISLRHQNWVLKIDYRDGKGTGNIIWHLGEGGDFALQNGIDPTDWFYAQHDANFSSVNTTGVFNLALFDNGNDREFAQGLICGPLPGQTPCFYSTVQELHVDEKAKTAAFLFHQILPPNLFSSFMGNTELLPNRNFEYDVAGTATSGYVFEVTPGPTLTSTPQTVWQMDLPEIFPYRAFRQPSLYPGVQW